MHVASQLSRTISIFRLALSYWADYRAIQRAERILPKDQAARAVDAIYQQGGIRFRREALRLQGLIIKVGQFLSARTDVLPLAFTKELQQLQDQVPAAPFEAVKLTIEEAYQKPLGEIFEDFEPIPVAAASLGQVHRARLRHEPGVVAVKVQRPAIRALAKTDLRALARIMVVLKRWTKVGRRLDTVRLFEEFRESVDRELDYLQEQDHLRHFQRNFAEWSNIQVPRVYESYARPTVLVMEFVEGVKLTDHEQLRAQGLDEKGLARLLVEAYLKQIVIDGFVQIDPHPGNFLAGLDGRLIFLDFGMMATIPSEHVDVFGQLVEFGLARNAPGVVDSMVALGFVRPSANLEILTRAVRFMLDRIAGVPLQEGPALSALVRDFQDFLYEEPLQFPAQYMFLGRAIGMLFGLVGGLDPDLDWMALLKEKALPMINERRVVWNNRYYQWVREQIGNLWGPTGQMVWDKVADKAKGWGQIGWRLPEELDVALNKIGRGSVSTRPELTPVLRRLDKISSQMAVLVAWVLAGFSAIVASLWQQHKGALWLATALYVIAGVAFLSGVVSLMRVRRTARRTRYHAP
ncbi:AarF/ABC1/UbiB kinase family protein [Sulfobacillus sp. hq2]|uniref:ABC1 kinase family protein n=1 Tax=Sulfobacillus sp. hq2 TaxID=2039167 RepID=UPI000CCFE006|nr:AarF/UbiB family protein [Sulfobacillus sp. hq2]POB09057.1 ABC transporter [Sulfobacillus sp. hq2]